MQGTYYPFNGKSPNRVTAKVDRNDESSPPRRIPSPPPKGLGSPKRAQSPAMYSDRRQSTKDKKPEVIEVVKTIKYEPEPDVETQQKVQKLENQVRT
jgi:hypothetical protein